MQTWAGVSIFKIQSITWITEWFYRRVATGLKTPDEKLLIHIDLYYSAVIVKHNSAGQCSICCIIYVVLVNCLYHCNNTMVLCHKDVNKGSTYKIPLSIL